MEAWRKAALCRAFLVLLVVASSEPSSSAIIVTLQETRRDEVGRGF
jgi:hypothetical protein